MPAELPDIPWIRRHVYDVPHYVPAGSAVGMNDRDIRNAHLISHQGSPATRARYGAPMPSHRHADPAHPAPAGHVYTGQRHPGLPPGVQQGAWEIARQVEDQVRAITQGDMTDAELEADPTPTGVWCHTAYSLAYVAATHDESLTAQQVWEIVEEQLSHLTIVDPEPQSCPCGYTGRNLERHQVNLHRCADEACITEACPEHPAHDGIDHTYQQHHNPSDHVGGGPCRCDVYPDGPEEPPPPLTQWQQEILEWARKKLGRPLTVAQVAELMQHPSTTDMADLRKIIDSWKKA